MILCPAAAPTEDALLFGMLDRWGQVTYSKVAIPVGKKLLMELPSGAEREFRFASACARSACAYWSDGCGLSSRLSQFQAFRLDGEDGYLPACSIRSHCRWFLQDGESMCACCQIHSRLPQTGSAGTVSSTL